MGDFLPRGGVGGNFSLQHQQLRGTHLGQAPGQADILALLHAQGVGGVTGLSYARPGRVLMCFGPAGRSPEDSCKRRGRCRMSSHWGGRVCRTGSVKTPKGSVGQRGSPWTPAAFGHGLHLGSTLRDDQGRVPMGRGGRLRARYGGGRGGEAPPTFFRRRSPAREPRAAAEATGPPPGGERRKGGGSKRTCASAHAFPGCSGV